MGAAADPVNVRFALTNRPENVRLVRELLAGIGSAVRLGDDALDDAMIAVSEASNNAVMHAYGGAEGSLELDLGVLDGRLEVRCRDYGYGFAPDAHRNRGRPAASDSPRSRPSPTPPRSRPRRVPGRWFG